MTAPQPVAREPDYADADETAHWYVDSPGGRAKHELNMACGYLALRPQLAAAREALRERGVHPAWCPQRQGGSCNCGLDAALAGKDGGNG